MSDINEPKPYPRMEQRPAVKPVKAALKAEAAPTTDNDLEALNLKVSELRAKRVPFGGRVQKLAYPARPSYHRHWFADHPGRVEEARSAGWEHVKDHEGKSVSRLHGRHRDGRAMIGYLMEIPEVLWMEDLQREQARVDEGEQSIKGGQVPRGLNGEKQAAFYVPSQGISIKNDSKG